MSLQPSNPAVAGVVLAGGRASRFGSPKQLAKLHGRPLVNWAVNAGLNAGLDPVMVVVGAAGELVRAALPTDPRLLVLANAGYARGMGSSLALAAARAGELGAGLLVVLLADMPQVTPAAITAVARAAAASPAALAAADNQGRPGHPVAFGRRYFEELSQLDGDTGGRDILLGMESELVLVQTPDQGFADVDTPDDLEAIKDQHL